MPDLKGPQRINRIVLREEFDDWAILFDPDTGHSVGINAMGVTLWKLMNGKRSLEEMVEAIGESYAPIPEEATEHVKQFIDSLSKQGFIKDDREHFRKDE